MAKQSQPNLDGIYIIDGQSSKAAGLNPLIYEQAVRMGIERAIIAAGAVDYNRVVMRTLDPAFSFGISAEQVKDSSGFLNDAGRSERRRGYWQPLNMQVNDRLIAATARSQLLSPFTIWTFSEGGQKQSMEHRLVDGRKRQSEGVTVGVTDIPHELYLRNAMADNWPYPVELVRRGLLECVVFSDMRSEIVKRYGRRFQLELLATMLASIMASIWHFPNMKGAADVFHALAKESPLVGCAFGLKYLVPESESIVFASARKLFGWQQRKGLVSTDHAVQTIIAAIEEAVHSSEWRAIDERPDLNRQCFLAIDVPFSQRNFKQWPEIVSQVELYLGNVYPNCTALWVAAAGQAIPELAANSGYWVQASLLWSLPVPPQPMAEMLSRRQTTGSVPSSATNGQVSREEVEEVNSAHSL